MDEIPGMAAVPQSIEVYSLEVDWTEPLLRARVETGFTADSPVPVRWDKIAPSAFKLQLAEPVQEGDAWRLGLETELPIPAESEDSPPAKWTVNPPAGSAARMGTDWPDQVRVGGAVGWAVHGATALRDLNPPPPVLDDTARVNVRWLGHPFEWSGRLPPFKLDSSWLFSIFDPLTGHGEFHLVVNRSGRPIPPSDLTDWIAAAWPKKHYWMAIHSIGGQVIAGAGEWRLGDTDTSRAPTTGKTERAGAVLVIESVKAGEWVDWARLSDASFQTSPTIPVHEPAAVVSGLLWPVPLRPTAWVGSTEGRDIEIDPYFQIHLQSPRPVALVRILHASAAGWSRHFDPREIRISLLGGPEDAFKEPIDVREIDGPQTVVGFAEPQRVSDVRVEYPVPSRMNHPRSPARMAALQLWGPWDGVAGLD